MSFVNELKNKTEKMEETKSKTEMGTPKWFYLDGYISALKEVKRLYDEN